MFVWVDNLHEKCCVLCVWLFFILYRLCRLTKTLIASFVNIRGGVWLSSNCKAMVCNSVLWICLAAFFLPRGIWNRCFNNVCLFEWMIGHLTCLTELVWSGLNWLACLIGWQIGWLTKRLIEWWNDLPHRWLNRLVIWLGLFGRLVVWARERSIDLSA